MKENEDLFDEFLDESEADELELGLEADDEETDDEFEDADDEEHETGNVLT